MPKPLTAARLPFLGLALLLALLLAALGGTSFQRKIETFQPLGFVFEEQQGTWRVTRAEPETGLRAGDGILREEAVASEAQLRQRLARQARTPLLVGRDGGVVNVLYQRPGLAIDYAYLILVAIGVLYLLIGLYTVLKDSRAPARLFYLWCLLSAAFYILSPPVIPRDGTDELTFLVDQFARIVLPALTLHLFLVFPAPLVTSRAGRFALPGIYLPAAVLVVFHADQIFRGGALFGPATGRTLAWVDRLEIWLLVLFSMVAVLVLFARLAARPIWEQRRQMHWILAGMVGGYAPFLALYVVPWSLGLEWPDWTVAVAVLALGLVPLGFAYAILKYKLWDIGVILRDSIAYSLTVLVGLCGFALIHLALERGLGDELATARNFLTFAAGLAIAGVLVPTKSAISTGLERWQYRRRLPQRRSLDQLGDDLLHERDLTRLCTTLIDRLTDGLMAYANLYLVQSGGVLVPVLAGAELPERIAPDALGDELWRRDVLGLSPAALPGQEPTVKERLFAAGYRYAFPLLVREHRVGILLVSYRFDDEPLNSEDLELTRGLLNRASLAIENAHLLEEVRRRLEEVSRLEEHNQGIIDSSPAGIAELDRDGRVVSANQAFSALVGVPVAELRGRAVEEVLPVRPLPEPGDGLVEVSYSDMSGRERYLQLAVAPHGDGGEALRILIVQDTSELIAMELALKEKERLAALGLLAAGVAHEVNTPLTGISSYAQLLLADVGEGHPHHEVLKKLERQTFRAAQIVNNLLEFARNRHDELAPVSLSSVVEECLALLAERLREAGVEAEWQAPAEPPRVLGNEGELGQVFNNLMVNAVDAMAPRGGGRLTVGLAVDGDRIVARITDTGPGIPPERLERVFQPFFSSKWGKGGTGLGLAITYHIVHRHRGTIRAENHPGGRGCTFLIELPRHAVH
ncbi:MAG TPA: ATP-binding protein [Thermoanaerobaculia bacterium]|jgi:hypothetical protein